MSDATNKHSSNSDDRYRDRFCSFFQIGDLQYSDIALYWRDQRQQTCVSRDLSHLVLRKHRDVWITDGHRIDGEETAFYLFDRANGASKG